MIVPCTCDVYIQPICFIPSRSSHSMIVTISENFGKIFEARSDKFPVGLIAMQRVMAYARE